MLQFVCRWSDVAMMRMFLLAVRHQGDPITRLIREMKWDTGKEDAKIHPFTELEIRDLEIYFSIMDPIEVLFSRLNSESQATLHLVYPSIQVRI